MDVFNVKPLYLGVDPSFIWSLGTRFCKNISETGQFIFRQSTAVWKAFSREEQQLQEENCLFEIFLQITNIWSVEYRNNCRCLLLFQQVLITCGCQFSIVMI
jgi:hypothetical protein